ncbi:MAG: phosphoribosyltransferase family protein [Ignisphaera sp.]
MSGLLTIYAFDELWNLSNILRYGLMALQHRGSQYYVACTNESNSLKCYEDEDIDVAKKISSHVTIASTYSYQTENLFDVKKSDGYEIVAIVDRPWSAISDFTSALVLSLKNSRNRIDAFRNTIKTFQTDHSVSIPSLMVLTSDREVFVWRGPQGFTTFALGSYGFDMAIASSESVAIDILGGDLKRFLGCGEGVYISRYLFKTFSTDFSNGHSGVCLFELLYLSRHDSIVHGISVYEFRKALGTELAKYLDREVDVVVGVPETALPYAIGFANSIQKAFDMAFVATGGRRRSMLASDPFEKIVAIHLKMNPIRSSLEGKRIAIVDDSMVTGSTMKTVSQILRFRVGVKEIHLFIASPPLVHGCPYNVMRLDVQNLLAANLSKELAKSYLEVDSLHWLSKEDVDRVARRFGIRFCGKCFGVDYFGG